MITLSYTDESDKLIQCEVVDWDAVHVIAQTLCNAPIELEYLNYTDGDRVGVFNLNTFEIC